MGWSGAVHSLAERVPIPVTAKVDCIGRLDAPVEATAYFECRKTDQRLQTLGSIPITDELAPSRERTGARQTFYRWRRRYEGKGLGAEGQVVPTSPLPYETSGEVVGRSNPSARSAPAPKRGRQPRARPGGISFAGVGYRVGNTHRRERSKSESSVTQSRSHRTENCSESRRVHHRPMRSRHSLTISPWRWATFHSPSSRRYTCVARKV